VRERPTRITKVLSANDTGETGAHQSGILVPREERLLAFFPALDGREKNPRCLLHFVDEWHERWAFAFIYYNNKFFGGTRNEYRLTRMTAFFRRRNAKPGDSLVLTCDAQGAYRIGVERFDAPNVSAGSTTTRLQLGTSWRVIDI
jgi:hypothetical protein